MQLNYNMIDFDFPKPSRLISAIQYNLVIVVDVNFRESRLSHPHRFLNLQTISRKFARRIISTSLADQMIGFIYRVFRNCGTHFGS